MATVVPTSFIKNEPVAVASFVAWLFSLLGTIVLGHTDLVTSSDWSTLSTILVPVVAGLVLAVLGKLARELVTPVAKAKTAVELAANKVGISDELLKNLVDNGVKRELAALEATKVGKEVTAVVEPVDPTPPAV